MRDLPPAANCPSAVKPCSPLVIAQNQASPGTFVAQGGFVYWRISGAAGGGSPEYPAGSIVRVATSGGAPEVLATVPNADLASIDVDQHHVYFAGQGHIGRIPLAGGAPEILAKPEGEVTFLHIAVDADNVYFSASRSEGGVFRLGKAPGTPTRLIAMSNATIIALDRDHVYWVNAASPAKTELHRIPKGGGDAQLLATLPLVADRFLPIGNFVYLPGRDDQDRGYTYKVPVAGGTPEQIASFDVWARALAADADSLYQSLCSRDQGQVIKLPLAGGAQVPVLSGGTCLSGLAVDQDSLYVADYGLEAFDTASRGLTTHGSVLKAKKCGCE